MKRRASVARRVLLGAMLCGGGGCEDDRNVAWTTDELRILASLALPEHADDVEDPCSDASAAAAWGRTLFFDPGLSGDGNVACATCHDPARAFTDGRALAYGRRAGQRNTPTLFGLAAAPFLGWDGHTDGIAAQSMNALLSPVEHDTHPAEVAAWVRDHHREAYEAVYGAWPTGAHADEQIFVHVGFALEHHLVRLALPPAPFDHFVAALRRGDPRGGGHLSAAALRGLRAFLREGCISCHHGPMFTDGEFHNLGLPAAVGVSDVHRGRAEGARRVLESPYRCDGPWRAPARCDALRYLDPDFADFEGAFKTPTLRNVELTGPYMHTGQFETLEAVLDFYRNLPGEARIGRRDPQLQPRGGALPIRDVVAFLRSLTSPLPRDSAEEDGAHLPLDAGSRTPQCPKKPQELLATHGVAAKRSE